jgi:hypothetical protein
MLRREKRQNRRILVSIEAEVRLTTAEGLVSHPTPMEGIVTNLSTTGLSMRLPEVQPIGTIMRLLVKLNEKRVLFYGTVRRVYPATAYHPSQFGHGLQIVAASDESIEDIYEYMMTITGRAGQIERTNVVEAFPAAVNAASAPPKSDQPLPAPPVPSPTQLATPG